MPKEGIGGLKNLKVAFNRLFNARVSFR